MIKHQFICCLALLLGLFVICGQATLARCHGAESAEDTLAILRGNAEFRVLLGRICLDVRKYKVGQHRRSASEPSQTPPPEQSLHVSVDQGKPNVVLQVRTAVDQWNLEAGYDGRFRLNRRTMGERPETLVMQQPKQGLIKIEWSQGDEKRNFSVLSLWHLWLEEPAFCETKVFPVLQKINPSWNLGSTAEELQRQLVLRMKDPPSISAREIQKLVDQFSDADSSRREKAYHRLKEIGLPALSPLIKTDLAQVDPEKRLRIGRLLESMQPRSDDTAIRITSWLAGDADACREVIERMEPAERRASMEYLKELIDAPPATIRR